MASSYIEILVFSTIRAKVLKKTAVSHLWPKEKPHEGDNCHLVPPTTQGLWVAPQPLAGLWVAPTLLHATTRPKQLFIDAIVIDTTNTHYTR